MISLTLTEIAAEFATSRDTARKKLDAAGIKATKRGKRDVYRLKTVIAALTAGEGNAFAERARRQTELLEIQLEEKRGELIRREDSETNLARTLKAVALELDVMPDEIERDTGASPEVIEKIEAKVDVIRRRMYDRIVSIDDSDDVLPGE